MLLSQHTSIFLCFALKQASPFPICMQKSVSRLVCTSRFLLKIKLFELRRFSGTCLDRYQQMIWVIANAHFPEINHISPCDWNVWIQNLYSTQLPSLSFASHFVHASALHAQVVACLEIGPRLAAAWPFLSSIIGCFSPKSLIPSLLSAVYVMQKGGEIPPAPFALCTHSSLVSEGCSDTLFTAPFLKNILHGCVAGCSSEPTLSHLHLTQTRLASKPCTKPQSEAKTSHQTILSPLGIPTERQLFPKLLPSINPSHACSPFARRHLRAHRPLLEQGQRPPVHHLPARTQLRWLCKTEVPADPAARAGVLGQHWRGSFPDPRAPSSLLALPLPFHGVLSAVGAGE